MQDEGPFLELERGNESEVVWDNELKPERDIELDSLPAESQTHPILFNSVEHPIPSTGSD